MADSGDRDQKTEEATPRRRGEAREKGQTSLSSELVAAVGLCAGLLMLTFNGGDLIDAIGETAASVLSSLGDVGTADMTIPFAAKILREAITSCLAALALVTLPAIALSLFVGYVQVGFQFTPKALEIELSKLDPIKGTKKLFSLRSLMRTGMSVVKMALISTAVVTVFWMHAEEVTRVSTNELGPLLAAIGTIVSKSIMAGLLVILLLAVVDMVFQRFQLERDLRMTKQEVKEEQRLTDGDPHVKAKIRRIQQQLAASRMMNDVPDATVVVTNPTHYAVALRYERDETTGATGAPVVVAKGVDHLAQRIKQLAKDNDVVCYEDVPLARALYAQTEIGQEIPEDLYAAVAVVLGYVYSLRRKVPALSMGA